MEKYYLFSDEDDVSEERMIRCISSLEKENLTTVVSASYGFVACVEIVTFKTREELQTVFDEWNIPFRFSSADAVSEYHRGFARGLAMGKKCKK